MEGVFIKSYLGKVIGRFLNKSVEKKIGYDPQIKLLGLSFNVTDDKVLADVSLEMTKEQFDKLIEEVTK